MPSLAQTLSAAASRLLLNPWFAGCTTSFGVLAGYLGAHYDKEVTEAHAFVLWPGTTFSFGATAFWLATFLFGVCFAGTLREQAKVAERTSGALAASTGRIETQTGAIADASTDLGRHVGDIEGRTQALVGVAGQIDQKTAALQAQTANLERLVQRLHTLPPLGFLREYANSGRLLVELTANAGPDASVAELDELVRIQLVCILKIVAVFDDGGADARYGCNVMRFLDSATLQPADLPALQARLRFAEAGVQLSGLAGVLDVQQALSVSSDSDGRPDPQLVAMALPVPLLAPGVEPDDGPVLPGAPETFLSGEASVFEATSDLARLSQDGRFSRFVIDQLRAFFDAPRSAIRSFACFPVHAPGTSPGRPIAVLNIHRDRENPSAAERIALLNPLLTPLCAGIGASLQALADHGARLAAPPKDSP